MQDTILFIKQHNYPPIIFQIINSMNEEVLVMNDFLFNFNIILNILYLVLIIIKIFKNDFSFCGREVILFLVIIVLLSIITTII